MEINYEVHVPELLATIGAAIVGLYIADSIQRRMARNQNQYTFVGGKLDMLWTDFNQYAEQFSYATQVDLATVAAFHKQALISTGFLKNVFGAYGLDVANITALEAALDAFQQEVEALPIEFNVYHFAARQGDLQTRLTGIHQVFSELLRQIHRI